MRALLTTFCLLLLLASVHAQDRRRAMMPKPAASAPSFNNAVVFDGGDNIKRGAGLTGASDGKKFTVSFWSAWTTDDENFRIVFIGDYPAGSGVGFNIYRYGQYRMHVDCFNSGGTRIAGYKTPSTGDGIFTIAAGFRHIIISGDLSVPVVQMYVDGVSAIEEDVAAVNDTIDFTQSNWVIGGSTADTFGMACKIQELYVNIAERLDLSVQGNRDKFYNAGQPVYLGADGSLPTGNPPAIYLRNGPSTFQNNLGSGGNFSVTGTLTDGGTWP